MTELITQEQFAAALGVFLAIAFAGCWAAGLAWGARAGDVPRGAMIGGLASMISPVIYGLWIVYSSRVAYDPASGTAGLHSVSVLLTNILIFVVVGSVAGGVAAVLLKRTTNSKGEAEAQ